MDNNYSLLRPFDLDAAKNGEPICMADGGSAKFLAHEPGHPFLEDWAVIVLNPTGISTHGGNGQHWRDGSSSFDLRMAPLCWVEGRPVYRGDKLWHTRRRDAVTAHNINRKGYLCEAHDQLGDKLENLTWEAPKQIKQVKLLAYIDSAGYLRWRAERLYGTTIRGTRVPSEDKIIELE